MKLKIRIKKENETLTFDWRHSNENTAKRLTMCDVNKIFTDLEKNKLVQNFFKLDNIKLEYKQLFDNGGWITNTYCNEQEFISYRNRNKIHRIFDREVTVTEQIHKDIYPCIAYSIENNEIIQNSQFDIDIVREGYVIETGFQIRTFGPQEIMKGYLCKISNNYVSVQRSFASRFSTLKSLKTWLIKNQSDLVNKDFYLKVVHSSLHDDIAGMKIEEDTELIALLSMINQKKVLVSTVDTIEGISSYENNIVKCMRHLGFLERVISDLLCGNLWTSENYKLSRATSNELNIFNDYIEQNNFIHMIKSDTKLLMMCIQKDNQKIKINDSSEIFVLSYDKKTQVIQPETIHLYSHGGGLSLIKEPENQIFDMLY